jgi:hypothetical protein
MRTPAAVAPRFLRKLFIAAMVMVCGGCHRNAPAPPANVASSSTDAARDATPAPGGKAALPDVGLSQLTGGYQVCSPRALHACRARAVTSLGSITFPSTDIAAAPSCDQQEARAVQHCAGSGRPYDAVNLKCLAGQGILNSLFHDDRAPTEGADEPRRLTLRCLEGEASIDLFSRP